MRTVGVGRRAAAFVIDYMIFAILGLLGALAIASLAVGSSGGTFTSSEEETLNAVMGLYSLGLIALGFGYWVILEAVAGQTLGKRLVGIRVVRVDGGRMTFGAALIRNLLRIVDGLFSYLVGAAFIWSSSSDQRLGDRAARTVVVYDYSAERPQEYGVNASQF